MVKQDIQSQPGPNFYHHICQYPRSLAKIYSLSDDAKRVTLHQKTLKVETASFMETCLQSNQLHLIRRTNAHGLEKDRICFALESVIVLPRPAILGCGGRGPRCLTYQNEHERRKLSLSTSSKSQSRDPLKRNCFLSFCFVFVFFFFLALETRITLLNKEHKKGRKPNLRAKYRKRADKTDDDKKPKPRNNQKIGSMNKRSTRNPCLAKESAASVASLKI